MKNCLITARDPATANDLSEVIPALLEVSSLFVRILAQQPAYKILHANLMEKDLLEEMKQIGKEIKAPLVANDHWCVRAWLWY